MFRIIFLYLIVIEAMGANMTLTGKVEEKFLNYATHVEATAFYKADRNSRRCSVSNWPYMLRTPLEKTLTVKAEIREKQFNLKIQTDWGYEHFCNYRLDYVHFKFSKNNEPTYRNKIDALFISPIESDESNKNLTYRCSDKPSEGDTSLRMRCRLFDENEERVKRLTIPMNRDSKLSFFIPLSEVKVPSQSGVPETIELGLAEIDRVVIYPNHEGKIGLNSPVEIIGDNVKDFNNSVLQTYISKKTNEGDFLIVLVAKSMIGGQMKSLRLEQNSDENVMSSATKCNRMGLNMKIEYFDYKNENLRFKKCIFIKNPILDL